MGRPPYFMCFCARAGVCVLACKSAFMGSTLLSSSFWRVCECLCVSASPQGLFQLRPKNTETLKELFIYF